ncbi:MAG: ATP-binding protein [Chloroflexi bacterium]|nr:ATP-binding protein [Chloroflexota bacterium]
MSARLSLTVKTQAEELARITAAVEDFGEREEWPPDLVFRVNLALEELGMNIMNHGYDAGLHEFDITLISEDDTLTIEIIDDGRPFDPLHDAKQPDVGAAIEDRPIGGLGIYFVREMMDEMHYRREDGKNHLTLVSRR